MNGDIYEEQICPTCGLGMATECLGHLKPSCNAPQLLPKEQETFCDLRNKIEDLTAALLAVMATAHFYDMPGHVQGAARKALERSGQ
jgi:hypothetical protein